MGDDGAQVEHVMSRGEARFLVLGYLVAAPFWLLFVAAFGVSAQSDEPPSTSLWIGLAGFGAVSAALEVVGIRIRRRSGMRARRRGAGEEVRLIRAAAATCGWPPRPVEVLLVAVGVVGIAAFVVMMVRSFAGG